MTNQTVQQQLDATRRANILHAAAMGFAEKGFHATTIKDVARLAGVADGTIYNYFENKHALLLGLFDTMTQTVVQNSAPAPLTGLDLRSFVRAYLRHPLAALEGENFQIFRVMVSEIMVNKELGERFSQQILAPMIATAEQYFEQWAQENGVQSPHIAVAMRAISSMIMGLIMQRVMGDETLISSWDTLPDVLADLLVDGLGRETA